MLMKMNTLPLKQQTGKYFWATLALTVLVLLTCVFSIINPEAIYTTSKLNQAYYPSDLGILFLGIPFLLIALWQVFSGKFIGLIIWLSALFFILYSYALYLFGTPFGFSFWIYLAIVGLSLYLLVRVLMCIDYEKASTNYVEKTPVKLASIILIALGALIFFRVVGLVSTTIMNGGTIHQVDIALWITDFVIAAPALIIVGFQLWRKRAFALITAPALYLQYIVLSLGLFPVFIYQAGGNLASIDMGGVIVIVVMIALCAFPLMQLLKSMRN